MIPQVPDPQNLSPTEQAAFTDPGVEQHVPLAEGGQRLVGRGVAGDVLAGRVLPFGQAGDRHKCFGMVDTPATVRDRIPADIISREGSLRILTEDEAYMPDGRFSKDAFIGQMKEMVQGAFAEGYERFRAVGDESFIIRNSVDIDEWFAAGAELNEIVPDFPHFFFCLYDLDLFDGDNVMYVLRTHPRIYVNGIVITNPHYVRADQLPA